MKKLLFFIAFIFISAQAFSQVVLGNDPIPGSLRVVIYPFGEHQIYRYENGAFQKQYYSGKSILLFDGVTSWSSGGAYSGPTPRVRMTSISNTKSGNVGNLVVRGGSVLEVTQVTSYAKGSAEIGYEWQIKNISGQALNDLRFYAGGDTYLAGGDQGSGYWDPATTTVGVNKFATGNATSGEQRNLLFQAITIPYSYESGYFNQVKYHVNHLALKGKASSFYTDNGYALEWRKASLAAGEVWTIKAAEKFISKTITDLNVEAPISEKIKPGETIDMVFKVTKDKSAATSTNFTVGVDLSGWTATLKSPSTVVLDSYDAIDVVVSVTAPAGVALGTGAQVTLAATNASGTAKDVAGVVAAEVPTVTTQPADLFVCSYGTQTISLTAINADSYQWQEFSASTNSWSNLTNGGAYSGVTTPNFSITVNDNALVGNKYRCVVTNATGQVQSRDALLTVQPLTIVSQPAATVSACADGGTTLLIVEATGSGTINYQWQKDGIDINSSTATTNKLDVTNVAANSGTYTCNITTSTGCGPITTTAAVVTISPLPTVTAPADATHCEGDLITLTATTGAVDSVKWDNGITDGVPFVATKTTTYTVTAYKDGCAVTDQTIITVNPTPLVQAGVDQNVCFGTIITLKGEGTADFYTWDNGVINNGSFIPPVGTTTYTVTGTTTATGCQDTDQIIITVNPQLNAAAANKTICSGETVDLTVTPSGGTGTYTYEWFDETGASIGTTATVSVSPTKTSDYLVNVGDAFAVSTGGSCEITKTVTVTVNPAIAVTVADATICNGASIELKAHVSGGSGSFTYLWSTGATTPSITISPTTSTDYTVTVSDSFVSSNGTTCTATSPAATVTVNPLPTISAGNNQTICPGDQVTLTGSGGTSYIWDNGVKDGVPFTPTATTTYTVTGTDANGCENTSSVTITITPLTEADAGPDATICSATTSFTLSGNTPLNGSVGQWSSPDNTLVFTDASSATATVSNFKTGLNTLIWTITNAGCTSVDTMSIAVDAAILAAAGPDDVVCDATTYQLKAAAIDASMTGTWSGGTGITFTPNANDPQATVNGLVEGDNVLTWTVSGGSCSPSSGTVTITRFVTQPANAGPDQSVCEDYTIITLAATAPAKGSGKWSSANPFVSFADPASPTTTVSGLVVGTHTLTWTTTNGICLSSDAMIITIDRLPVVSAGPDADVCDDTDFYLAAQSTAPGVWTASDANVTFDNATSPATIAHALPEGTTTFTWTVTTANCGTITDALIVNRSVKVVADAGADINICAASTATLTAATPAKGTGLWTSTDSGVVIDSPTSPTTNVSNISSFAGFFWTVTNGSCTSIDNVSVLVNPLPGVSAGPPLTICAGDPVTLNGAGAGSYTWDNGVINGKEFIPTATQTYTVTGTAASGCTNTAQTTVTVNPIPVVDAGADVEVCSGEPVTLTATGADLYLWTGGVVNGEPFVPTATTTYYVTGISSNCSADDSVTVTVKPLPAITATPSYPPVCADVPAFELLGAEPRGGIFSGQGITTEQRFDPGLAGTGTHTLTYLYIDQNTLCSNSVTFDIVVDPLPIITVMVDPYICEDGTATFIASGGTDYKWEGDSLNTDTVRFTPPIGVFSQRVTGYDQFGCASEATASSTVEKRPVAGIATAQESCSNITDFDLYTGLAGYDAGGTWSDDDNTGALSGSTFNASTVGAGIYNFTYTVSSTGVCADDTETLSVTVIAAPNAGTATPQTICGDVTDFDLYSGLAGYDAGGLWSDDDGTGVLTGNIIDATLLAAGTYNFTYTAPSIVSCTDVTETLAVTIELPPNAGIDNAIVFDATDNPVLDLFINLGGSPDATGTWSDDDDSGADISDPSAADFTGVRHGTYNFTYVVTGEACSAAQAVLTVEVNYVETNLPFSPSEGVSPNDDGINDTWFIADIEEFPDNYVRIMDRAGAVVFELRGYENDTNAFDGRANVGTLGGKKLSAGTYFYIIDKGDGSEPVSGYFTLLR